MLTILAEDYADFASEIVRVIREAIEGVSLFSLFEGSKKFSSKGGTLVSLDMSFKKVELDFPCMCEALNHCLGRRSQA